MDTGIFRLYFTNEASEWAYKDSSPVTENEWHQLAWVYNHSLSTMDFYIDGQLDYSHAAINPSRYIDTLDVGVYNDNYLNGTVDDVRIYDEALTPKQISDY